jgi:3-oxoacyl-[acyl-carrier-protein] synthase-1/3-oxoacyl-[acyl-carrier-protein] synthase II
VTAVAIVAFGAVSSLGEGRMAAPAGEPGAEARVAIARDPILAAAGLGRPFAARARVDGDDRATTLLARALSACAADLDAARPAWRGERVGVVLGTSSGGMRAAERAFDAIARGEGVADVEAPQYFGPFARAIRRLQRPVDPCVLVLGACASATMAIGLGARWLARGDCDLVLAGGFDEVTVFVAAGFEALRAVTSSPPPRPFRMQRDGMALGEGAGVVALARADDTPEVRLAGRPRFPHVIRGYGAASDAVHLTAPDREGAGLARAIAAALEEAGSVEVDLVSAHATATPFNDAAESRALATALGCARARAAVVHPFKAQIGHALGAAGVLELLAAADALERGLLPAAAGEGAMDPDAPARLLARAQPAAPRAALKISSAFGGANAALVLGPRPASPRSRVRRGAFIHAAAAVDAELPLDELAARTRTPLDRLGRADPLVRLALAAVARLESSAGPLGGTSTGVIVGSAYATLETNALFAARIRARGASAAEPRRFPYTSPNAVAGQVSMAFGSMGPSFTVGGGMHAGLEALAAGAVLVEAGDAERIVVVAADDVGPATRALGGEGLASGAVAVLVTNDPQGARARIGAIELRRGVAPEPPGPAGHRALLPLVESLLPPVLLGSSPPDARARIELHPAIDAIDR